MDIPNAYPNKNIDVDKLIRFLYQYRNYIVDFNHQQYIYQRDVSYPKFYKEPGKKEMYVYAVMSKLSGQKIDLRFEFCIFNVQKSELAGKLDYSIHFYFYKTDVYTTQRTPALILYSRDLQTLFTVAKWLWGDRVDSKFTQLAKAAIKNYKLIGEKDLKQKALWYEMNDVSVIVGLNEEQRINDLLFFLSSRAFSDKRSSGTEAAILSNLRTYLPSNNSYKEKPNSDSTAADRVLKVLYETTLVIGKTQFGNVTAPAFEHLYNNMNDNLVGPDNFTEVVHLLYRLWQGSSYSNLNNKEYDSYNKQSSLIPYSIKQFYLKRTGMRFQFRSKEIVKEQSQNSKIIETRYHIYQPVLPIDFDKIHDEEYLEKLFLIPAFYLKMLDDKIKWENLIKVLFLILDAVTIASGIGIITKFRYLRYLSTAEKVFSIFVGTLEIGVGSLNILLNIAEEDKYPKFCHKLRIVLLVVELSSALMAEAIIKPALRKYAAEALEEFSRLNRYLQETEEMTRAKQQLEAIVTPEKYPLGVPEKLTDDLYMLRKNGDEVFRGTKKEVDELVERLKKMPDTDAKKFIDMLMVSRKPFQFRGFSKTFDDHILRGEIKIAIKHAQTGKIKETYKYATGKGGKNADQITPPWQAKVDNASGFHMHKYIDEKIVKKIKTIETKKLHTGELVEKVEIQFFIKELGGFYKKKTSTLWPKSWDLNKIQQVTKEASENIRWSYKSKYRGISKEGYEVEFFSSSDGIVDNAYLLMDNL